MIELCFLSLVKDMGEKAGRDAVVEFLQNAGAGIAERMGTEEHYNWASFNQNLRDNRTLLATEGKTEPYTEQPVTVNGNTVGYFYSLPMCPFGKSLSRHIKVLGALPPIHAELMNHYNSTVNDSAVGSACPLHQAFREEFANRVKIGGKNIQCFQIACKSPITGGIKFFENNIKTTGLYKDRIVNLLRNGACVYALVEKGALKKLKKGVK